jgi:hypothetical protein
MSSRAGGAILVSEVFVYRKAREKKGVGMGIAARLFSAALLSGLTVSGCGWAQTPALPEQGATSPAAGERSTMYDPASSEARGQLDMSSNPLALVFCRFPGQPYTPWDEKMNCSPGDPGVFPLADSQPSSFLRVWPNASASPLFRVVDSSSNPRPGGGLGFGQDGELAQAAAPASPAEAQAPALAASPASVPEAAPVQTQDAAPASATTPKTFTVPAGTKVLLEMRSAVNTKSAKPGDGVYLTSIFPVTVGNRVMIPVGVYVQGVVDHVTHPDRGSRKAQIDMHFTSMIFPNGSVVEIPGVVDALPGATKKSIKDGEEGTIEQEGDKGRDAAETAKVALPAGAGVGTIGGAQSGHPLEGGLAGLGAGAAAVGLVALFTRNADVDIPSGTQVEMELQRPLILEEENLAPAGSAAAPAPLAPAPGQPRPIAKPAQTQILCPPGSLGCR